MPAYAALLRAINVGGTGRLAMSDLRRLCEAEKFERVATYIQSGNAVFHSPRAEAAVRKVLERALAEHMGQAYGVFIRSAPELTELLRSNPFPKAAPNRVMVLFLDEAPASASLASLVAPAGEELRASGRHLIIHYPGGVGQSKLKLPFQKSGTMRNLNTVRKLLAMLDEMNAV